MDKKKSGLQVDYELKEKMRTVCKENGISMRRFLEIAIDNELKRRKGCE